jgi:hypothetical protein
VNRDGASDRANTSELGIDAASTEPSDSLDRVQVRLA